MKKRSFVWIAVFCLLVSGCGEWKTPPKNEEKMLLPARSLLVVPTDRRGAQAFLVIRLSDEGEVRMTGFPRETVFSGENADTAPLFVEYADGRPEGTAKIRSRFLQNGVPVERVLSVDVERADGGLYGLLSALGNNLLFTNPPDFVYTMGNARENDGAAVFSASQLRALLTVDAEKFDRPEDYVFLRTETAKAVIRAMIAAFSTDGAAAFSAVNSAGKFPFSPADEAVFCALYSPNPRVCVRPVRGEFAGEGSRRRFYEEES